MGKTPEGHRAQGAVAERMAYRGLRQWLEQVEKMGELLRVNGAHWDTEMGAITQNYGLEEATLLALGAGVDLLLVSENTVKREPRAAQRVIGAIQRALDEGRLTRKTVQAALTRVGALRARVFVP